ncbi:MAG: hypothetical protein NVS3B12_26640 [Acidimicrobiales bacterium]
MSGVTFDTGMLVALERNERAAWVVLRRCLNRHEVPTVPSVVIAQSWRDGRRQAQLARALGQCRPDDLDERLARRAGELCGRAGTADIVDAVVVESASRRHDVVFTSEGSDLEHLAGYVAEPVAIVSI